MFKRWQFWVGVLVSVGFSYYALMHLKLEEVLTALSRFQLVWLVPAVAVYFVAVFLRTYRWHYLLRHMKRVPVRRLFPVVTIGYMGNNVYPFRAGEVIRAYVLKRKEGVSGSASLATILVERIFDGLTMLTFVFAIVPFVPAARRFSVTLAVTSALFFGALAVFFVIASSPRRTEQAYGWFVSRLVPARFRDQVRGILDKFLVGLQVLRRGRDLILIFGISIVLWLVEAGKYWFVMQGFYRAGVAINVPFHALVLTAALVNLATSIPLPTIGYIGPFEVVGKESLMLFGVGEEIALGFMLVLHAALWFPITMLGFYYMARESISWAELSAAQQAAGQEQVQRLVEDMP
ncbi:MAG: flippase-like domain-containing protein [Anaerolineae bacterium]|nr:MAG: flippase-like domain-containing protein [Anaerolineae bacterium]